MPTQLAELLAQAGTYVSSVRTVRNDSARLIIRKFEGGGCGGTGVLMRTCAGRAIIVGTQGSIVFSSFVFVLCTLYEEESSSFLRSEFAVRLTLCFFFLLRILIATYENRGGPNCEEDAGGLEF